MITIDQLTVKYVGRKQPTLQNVNLHINAGETVLLLGASGCGKSTLALTLNGLIPHAIGGHIEGTVTVDRLDTQQTTVAELARKVGIVFQDPEAQFVTLKVEDEIVFGLENLRFPPEQMRERVDQALAKVAMDGFHEHRVERLSGGQKQRITLAALLAMEPHILVFDEPTANLDPIGTQDVFALIGEQQAQQRHTIILIEHKLDELMHLIDRVIVLGEQGSILADGAPRIVFDDYADTLQTHGIWIPQICLLAHHLRTQGIVLDPFPVTLDEAEMALHTIAVNTTPDQVTNAQKIITTSSLEATIAIDVRSLSFSYGRERILDDVSLTIPQGDFLGIVGANGAGKTTLAQHLVHILPPPNKTIFLNNNDLTRISAHDLMTQIGYVFQNPEHQFITNSVYDEVAYGLRTMRLHNDEVNTRTMAMLERFGLARYAKANPFTLSHGEKRRLSVATMLAVGQEILILDEPTFGQDQRNATAMMELLCDLHSEGRTIIIITHDMGLVAEYTRHVAVMSNGKLLFHGPTPIAFAQPDLLHQARLTLPPLARLTTRMAEHRSAWQGLLTIDDIIPMFDQTRTTITQ